jgi:RND family efflux transporter MFP subunit
MSARRLTRNNSLLSLAISVSLLTAGCGKKPNASSAIVPPTSVKIQLVEGGNLQQSQEFVGTLEAKQRVILRPQISGRVVQIMATLGQKVATGTPILQLQPQRGKASVNSALANADAQRAVIQNAQAAVSTASSEIARQDSEMKRLQAEIRSRNSDLQLASVNYKRTESLVTAGAQARQELDNKIQARSGAQASRDAAIEALESAKQARNSALSQLTAAQATVNQSISQLKRAQADADVQIEDLRYNRVVAPINGIVGDIPVRVGDYVNLGDALTNIIQNDELDLRIPVPTNRINDLRVGLPVELLEPKTGQRLASGRLNFVSPQVDTAAQAVLTKARFPNSNNQLRDGQFVRAKMIWSQSAGILVPVEAVSQVGAQDFVYVSQTETKDGKSRQVARQKPVKLGVIQGQSYQVISGIEKGEQLIVSGIQSLTDGADIQAKAQTESASSR